MAAKYPPKGRGRGRGQPHTSEIGSLTDIVPPPTIPKATDVEISLSTDDVETLATPSATTTIGRGRSRRAVRKVEVDVPDPEWTVSDLSKNDFQSKTRPSKPSEVGTIGEQITVLVNYFPIIKFPQEGIAYQYDIEIKNKKDQLVRRDHQRAVYNAWLSNLRQKYPNIDENKIVFDGRKLVFTFEQSLPDIDETGNTEKINCENRLGRQEEYEVFIKRVGDPIDLSILRVLRDLFQTQSGDNIRTNELESVKQMLSIVLHEKCSSRADFIFNRSFFSRPLATDRHGSWDLGLGKAVWRGFYSCLVLANGAHQLLMNIDISHRVFIKEQPFLNFLYEVIFRGPSYERRYDRHQEFGPANVAEILKFFGENINGNYYADKIKFLEEHCKNRSVRSHVVNDTRGYKIVGLGGAAETQTFFWKKENRNITVKDYYETYYRINLQYPTLPTLRMSSGALLPMELIEVEPVKVTKITDEQRAALCLKSSMPPSVSSKAIRDVRQNPNQQCFEEDPFIAAWNFHVRKDMLRIPARVLPPPDIDLNSNSKVIHKQGTKRGVWNHSRTEFYEPTELPTVWALINLSSSMNRQACETFYNELNHVASDRGVKCSAPVLYQEYNAKNYSKEQIIDELRAMMVDNNDCKFLFVILPEDNPVRDEIYGDIKELCELESGLGIVTQMLKLKKDEGTGQKPWNYSRLNNLLMKINVKLGGINSVVSNFEKVENFFSQARRIMYVGVDLSHGPAGSSRRHSTVAVVASVGDIPIRYLKEIYVQDRPPEADGESWETVVKMKDIMKSLICQYKEHQGDPPSAIVIYRDGISTSEFDTVFEKELTAIREACVELSGVYRPYLTYIVVNKRHHTRIYPTGSDENVEAGTLVDSPDVTNPTTYSFFLNSHYVDKKKGTSRPTYYHVLYDDNKLKPDQVHQLTYALCYLHSRCSSSISIPAPVKYADLLAFRASRYRSVNYTSDTESTTPTTEGGNETNGSKITSKRIVLSSKLEKDCPFFL